ncbi:unnamed protein product [Schistosoma mattheei]|uniref:Uncharacterized protein n=1 Tax=Schistosoma mattheei TaxID=31246 RepID=A0A3P8J8I1_9TREM|nr:unnamed protein product [Schistosoma mattheei]
MNTFLKGLSIRIKSSFTSASIYLQTIKPLTAFSCPTRCPIT